MCKQQIVESISFLLGPVWGESVRNWCNRLFAACNRLSFAITAPIEDILEDTKDKK